MQSNLRRAHYLSSEWNLYGIVVIIVRKTPIFCLHVHSYPLLMILLISLSQSEESSGRALKRTLFHFSTKLSLTALFSSLRALRILNTLLTENC